MIDVKGRAMDWRSPIISGGVPAAIASKRRPEVWGLSPAEGRNESSARAPRPYQSSDLAVHPYDCAKGYHRGHLVVRVHSPGITTLTAERCTRSQYDSTDEAEQGGLACLLFSVHSCKPAVASTESGQPLAQLAATAPDTWNRCVSIEKGPPVA
eukprot:4179810-Prymnesium_polylepis.2